MSSPDARSGRRQGPMRRLSMTVMSSMMRRPSTWKMPRRTIWFRLQSVMGSPQKQTLPARHLAYGSRPPDNREEHEELMEIVIERDGEKAGNFCAEHIMKTHQIILYDIGKKIDIFGVVTRRANDDHQETATRGHVPAQPRGAHALRPCCRRHRSAAGLYFRPACAQRKGRSDRQGRYARADRTGRKEP